MKKRGMIEVVDEVSGLREELDDHLAAINENTEEIESNFSYLMTFGERLQNVEAKIEYIYKKLQQLDILQSDERDTYKQIRLTEGEQKVFVALYEQDRAMEYAELESATNKSRVFVRNNINSMIEKGVPIKKQAQRNKPYFFLDSAFKDMQAKENILRIDRPLTLDCFDQSIVG